MDVMVRFFLCILFIPVCCYGNKSGFNSILKSSSSYKYPFLDPSLAWDKRVDDLVSRLTLDEVISQTSLEHGASHSHTPAISRLGIGEYVWITECGRGQARTYATAFPQALGLAASFSTELLYNVSYATSYEVRAQFNADKAAGKHTEYKGLSCFSPVINIMRHPLWGRNQETYGEDPFLSSVLVRSFVRGLQGDHPRYVRAASGCKHFDAHGGPDNFPVSRHSFDAKISERDWRMTFLPQFKSCVQEGTFNIMCSYNSINGVPACANKKLLTDILRSEYNFSGFVISDDGAVGYLKSSHHYVKSETDATIVAIKAGLNMELGGFLYRKQKDALAQGNLTEEEIRNNVKPLFYTRMRLGEFDPPNMNPYNSINQSVVQSAKHRNIALDAAMMSFVLMKNENNTLPVSGKVNKVAVIGPHAGTVHNYGSYAPLVNTKYATSPYDGLKKLGKSSVYAAGCSDNKCAEYDSKQVIAAVKEADLVFISLGLGTHLEQESNDRHDLELPGSQLQMLLDATLNAKNPVVVLLFNADPLNITWAKNDPRVGAILECFYPAQEAGPALFNVLTATGPRSVPAGRLPATWPLSLSQIHSITNYSMDGLTYRYYHGDPLYPFGYGLSYSRFVYQNLSFDSSSIPAGHNQTVSVQVLNVGNFDADEVVQVYMSWGSASVPVPRWQLVAVKRTIIPAGQQVQLHFNINPQQMAVWVDNQGFVVEPGKMTIYAGGQQPEQKTNAGSNVLSGIFTITGRLKL